MKCPKCKSTNRKKAKFCKKCGRLVYFGYPQAHEDDAYRAVSAALEIVDAMGTLYTRLETEYDVYLAVRLGIQTVWA